MSGVEVEWWWCGCDCVGLCDVVVCTCLHLSAPCLHLVCIVSAFCLLSVKKNIAKGNAR